jgi:MoxR-like ATPase
MGKQGARLQRAVALGAVPVAALLLLVGAVVRDNAAVELRADEPPYVPPATVSASPLADEINRASAKTQSALLEVMQEGTVTFGTTTRSVHIDPEHPELPPATDEPYMVLATQNPLDADGTYPLPAAQLDRFLMRISMGYPPFRHELEVLRAGGSPPPPDAAPVLDGAQVGAMIRCAGRIQVTDAAYRYALRIVGATRAAAATDVPPRLATGFTELALAV